MKSDTSSPPGSLLGQFRAFAGFPYLVTRIAPALYHINLLPRDEAYGFGRLRDIARRQVGINRLRACLVMDDHTGLYLEPDGQERLLARIPGGGTVDYGKLVLCETFAQTEDLVWRRNMLSRFVASTGRAGSTIYFGDLLRGARYPTEEESRTLPGRQDNGVPRGLARCPVCGEWRGECFDTFPVTADLIVKVCCRCENDNRCVGCGRTFDERRLNANFFSEADGLILHLAGFAALSHTCPGAPKQSEGGSFHVVYTNKIST